MSNLYISEYASTGMYGGNVGVGFEPCIDQTPIAMTASSAQSTAFNTRTSMVRLHVDTATTSSAGSVLFGTNPTAVTGVNKRLAAGQTEYFMIPQGQAYKVAVVTTA